MFLHAQRPARAEEAQLSIVVEINHRARTAEQKELRRQAVLDAAEAYFHEVGYEAFSMAKLARNLVLSKARFISISKLAKSFSRHSMNGAWLDGAGFSWVTYPIR